MNNSMCYTCFLFMAEPKMSEQNMSEERIYIIFSLARNTCVMHVAHAQSIGGSRGCRWRTPPPQQDPILSFLHMFSLKNTHVGGRRPPPPTGNPGSATAIPSSSATTSCFQKRGECTSLLLALSSGNWQESV